jgi:hypothetical protein
MELNTAAHHIHGSDIHTWLYIAHCFLLCWGCLAMVVFLLGEAELVIFLDILPLVKLFSYDISQ